MPSTLVHPSFHHFRQRALRVALVLGAGLVMTPWPVLAAPAKARAPAANQVLASCSWDRPGHNKFSGDVPTAVDRYTDIPADVRARLKQRMTARDYDDMVSIKRDRIAGKRDYDAEIRDMYFGDGNICRTVTRTGWNAQMHERGMVYCDSGHCILVPTVCRNVSRIVRREAPSTATAAKGGGGGADEGELAFDPPGAGLSEPQAGTDGPAVGAGGGGSSSSGDTFASQSSARAPAGPWFAGLGPGIAGPQGGLGPRLEGPAAEPVDGRLLPLIGTPGDPSPPLSPWPGPDAPFNAPTTAVPEPQTWAMLVAGLAMLANVTRRRRRGVHSPTAR